MDEKTLLLDGIEKIYIDQKSHFNERRSLKMMRQGLLSLANSIRGRELRYAELSQRMNFYQFGATSPEEEADLNFVACVFHWFGVSLCNYARLVGYIRGLEKNLFTANDLAVPKELEKISKAVTAYVESIPELEAVLVWRNKASGIDVVVPRRQRERLKGTMIHFQESAARPGLVIARLYPWPR